MFKFPLQRLLDLKAKREQEMARRLAAARTDAVREDEQRDAIASLPDAGNEQVAAGAESALSVGELVSMRHALTQLGQRLEAAQERADAAHQVVSATNNALAGAIQERQVLDRLRERRLEEHRADENMQERAAMDAVALSRFNATRPGRSDSTTQ
ncbi:MAG: flagellar export protein FliJ [Gemmatimonadaceae bacterium]